MRLALRFVPVKDADSLATFALRLSATNGFPNLRWLTQIAKLPNTFITKSCDLSGLASILDGAIDVQDLEQIAQWPVPESKSQVRYGDCILGARSLNLAHPKVCIECLKSSGRTSRLFDIRCVLACPDHGCLLIDRCPSCCQRLSWFRPSCAKCACGADLSTASPLAAPWEVQTLTRWSVSLITKSPIPQSERFAPVRSLSEAFQLLWFFGTCSPNASDSRSRYIAKPDVLETLDPVIRGFRAISNWPDGLHAWLDQYRSKPSSSIHRSYQGILERLRQAFPDPSFAYLFDEIRGYLKVDADIPLKRSSFFYSSPAEIRVLTGVHAAKKLGTSVNRISQMIRVGHLSGEIRATGSRNFHLVNVASVKRIQAQRSRILRFDEASARLGISIYQIKQLKDVLQDNPDPAGLKLGITIDAINELVGRLSGLSRGSHTASDLLRVSDIPRQKSISLGSALQRIVSGRLAVYEEYGSTQPCLMRFLVRRSDLLGRRFETDDELLSVRVAAKQLGVSVRMIPILVKSGCLTADVQRGKALQKLSVSASSIARFREKFIMTREIATKRHTSTKVILRQMHDDGITPVVASEPHKGISAVWDRAAINRYL
jgi:hypothetical protein